jgi:C-lobe and N-lobe beta barrels of Tf-binding protein B
MCPIEKKNAIKLPGGFLCLFISSVLNFNHANAEQTGLTGDGTTTDQGVPVTLPEIRNTTSEQPDFSGIISKIKESATLEPVDQFIEEFLNAAFESSGDSVNLNNPAIVAISKRVKQRFDDFSLKSGVAGVGNFTKDVLVGVLVDIIAEEAMKYQIERGGYLSTVRAATTFVLIKQGYIIATSKGPAGIVAGQIGLLRDIAIMDMQVMQEYLDANAIESYAALRAEMWGAYGDYVHAMYSAKTKAAQDRAKRKFEDRLAEISSAWNLQYDIISPGAGSLDTAGKRPGDNRNETKLTEIFEDLSFRFLYLSELNVPEIRAFEDPTPYAPQQWWTTDVPFFPVLSGGTTDQSIEVVSYYEQAPDYTEDIQAEIIENAPRQEPPDYTAEIAALRAQRDALIIAEIDAEFVVSESNNRLAILRYEDLETVNYYLGVVDAEVAELRAELANGPLSPADAARFQSLLTYQETLEAENGRINDLIEAEELKIENARLAIQGANSSLVANQSGLVGYGFNMATYVPPTHNPGTPTDWTGYEYEPPPFPNQSPMYDNAYGYLVGGVTTIYNQIFARDMAVTPENGITRLVEDSVNGSYVLLPMNDRTSDGLSHLSWGTDRAVAVEGSGAILPYIDNVFWLYGEQTPSAMLEQRTGRAEFAGSVYAHYYRFPANGASTVEYDSVTGALSFSADFSTDTITGDGRFNVASNGENFSENFSLSGSLSDDNTSLVRSVSGTEGNYLDYHVSSAANIVAGLTGAGGSGFLIGSFYGPDGLEAGGSISYFLGDRESAIAGVFVADVSDLPNRVSNGYIGGFWGVPGSFIYSTTGTATTFYPATTGGYFRGFEACAGSCGTYIIPVQNERTSAAYSYASWGKGTAINLFDDPENPAPVSQMDEIYWLDGERTAASVIERKTGTANFSGEIHADYYHGYPSWTVDHDAVTGSLHFSADFANDSLTGYGAFLVNSTDSTEGSFSTGFVLDGGIIHTSESDDFHSGLAGTFIDGGSYGVHGGLAGSFYGPDGSEAGGHIDYFFDDWSGKSLSGIFVTQEGTPTPEPIAPTPASQSARALPVAEQATYSYASWGTWEHGAPSGSTVLSAGGYWLAGEATPGGVVDAKTGSATYTGEMAGRYLDTNGQTSASTGDISLTANFDTDRISGNMEMRSGDASTGVLSVDAGIAGGNFSQDAGSFGVEGSFFGADAEEIGGTAWATTDGGSFDSVFRAGQ